MSESAFQIFVNALLANNFVLAMFLGLCPFLGVSGKLDTAFPMGVATTFVMLVASLCAYGLNLLLTAFHLEFDQPVHVGVEAGEGFVEAPREAQVVDDALVEAFARNQQRDTRRVRRQQRGRDAPLQHVDVDPRGLAMRAVRIGLAGGHRRLQV